MCTLLLQYLYCYSKKVLQDDKRLLFTQSLSATLCLLYLQAFISSYVLFIAPFKWSTLHFCFLTIAKWDDEDIIQQLQHLRVLDSLVHSNRKKISFFHCHFNYQHFFHRMMRFLVSQLVRLKSVNKMRCSACELTRIHFFLHVLCIILILHYQSQSESSLTPVMMQKKICSFYGVFLTLACIQSELMNGAFLQLFSFTLNISLLNALQSIACSQLVSQFIGKSSQVDQSYCT